MFSTKSLLFFTTAATLLQSSSCNSGGTTLSGTEVSDCRVVGLGSIAKSFKIIADNGPPRAEFVFNLFSDKYTHLPVQLGPGTCFSGSVGMTPVFVPTTVPHSLGEIFA
ncbi:hypothetical protein B0H13DRAFT_2005299 [Mycena leptocephala]|nr:hypothetical protein B0H13DRAFT_2005299 [Mycena leptocephala]